MSIHKIIAIPTHDALIEIINMMNYGNIYNAQNSKVFEIIFGVKDIEVGYELLYPRYMMNPKRGLIDKTKTLLKRNKHRVDAAYNLNFYELTLMGINDVEYEWFEDKDKYLGENGEPTEIDDMPKWSTKLEATLITNIIEKIINLAKQEFSYGCRKCSIKIHLIEKTNFFCFINSYTYNEVGSKCKDFDVAFERKMI